MHQAFFRVLSFPHTSPPLVLIVLRTRHVSSLPPRSFHPLIERMRGARIAALTNISDKAELESAVVASMRDFLHLATSKQKSKLVAMDAIGLIKLCRKSAQPSLIAEIWPHIQKLALLPAKDEKTSCALIGSAVSSALEAYDSSTAASIWVFLRSSPHLPLEDAIVLQLLSALTGRPDLVVEMITALQNGTLRVRANVKHFNAALQALGDTRDECERMFEQVVKHKMVDAVTLVVRSQIHQRRKDLPGALNTLSTADSLSITPHPAHYTVLLSCAADMRSLAATKRIHQHLTNHPAAHSNNIINGALVHSYAQCGDLESAIAVFEAGGSRTVEHWTILVKAYSEHGMAKEAAETVERMTAVGVRPNEVTVLCLLNAASHAGLGLGVRQLYDQLQARFPELRLSVSHRTCVVDGLARAGLFDEAVAGARALEHFVSWVAVLGGARSHGRLEIGELALNEIRRLNPDNSTLASAHVLMSHLYTMHGRDEDASHIRRRMKDEALRKLPGESSIEVNGVLHTFRVGDTSHPEMQQIISLNDELHERLRAQGYAPDIAWASRDANMPDQTKEQLLCEHSERLALVYGLLHSAEGPLTIFKNLRVCGDCHDATKHASKVLVRKLVVKDMNRWHVFENGKCSCGDFW